MAILFMLFKGVLYTFLMLLLWLAAYLGFWFVLRPFKKRRYFKRFQKDVGLSPGFVPLLGDFKYLKEDYIDKGKFVGQFLRDWILKFPDKKAFFAWLGMDDILFINDVKLFSEFQKLVPHAIDREPIDLTGFGRVGGTGGLGQDKTNDFWKKRRETLTKTIGVNFATRFIPIFLRHCEQEVRTFKTGQVISMSDYANVITFEIIWEILFGWDIRDKLDLVNYTDTNGNIEKVNLYQCLMKISHDCSFAAMNPMNVIFPWLVHYGIGSENRRNNKNSDEFERVIKDVWEKSEDNHSVYNQVLNTGEFDKVQVYKDIMTLLFAGHETTSKSLCSALFQLKKNPDIEKKLRKELNEVLLENGKNKIEDLHLILGHEKLDKLEYLTWFVKEVLRHDLPAVRSLGYKSKTSFKLGDILIPKSQIITLNMYASHYSEDQWKEPLKFIPERFDPSSEYFLTPEGKSRNPLAWCPFTFGQRTWPGRSLGLMELRILVIYFMLTIDYEVDEETLKNEDIAFAILSPFSLNIKIKDVHVKSSLTEEQKLVEQTN